jgi:arginyl-tRNA synthetase
MSQRYHDVLGAVTNELNSRLVRLAASWKADNLDTLRVALAPTRDAAHGDFATAVALAAAKAWKRNPLEIAQGIAGEDAAKLTNVARIEAVKPGFVNVTMAPRFWSDVVLDVLRLGPDYGKSDTLASMGPMLIEFVSANPTGPLNVVQGRSSSLVAALAAMFRFAGAAVSTETYVNDHGVQLDLLADSLYARYATLCGVATPLPDDGHTLRKPDNHQGNQDSNLRTQQHRTGQVQRQRHLRQRQRQRAPLFLCFRGEYGIFMSERAIGQPLRPQVH